MKRLWHVIHSHGSDALEASDARSALRLAFIPAGYRDARAVIAADVIIHRGNSGGPFTALIGTPGKRKAGR